MKKSKSVKSLSSFKSTKSMRATLDGKKGDVGEFLDLCTALPEACAKLQCPYNIKVKKEQQKDEFYKAIKYGETTARRKKMSILPTQIPAQTTTTVASQPSEVNGADDEKEETETVPDRNTLTISALYDTYNCLTEILLNEIKVPRILVQVIGLLAPYFQNLTTLTVRRSKIDYYIIHEISKILEVSSITNMCLDNSPALQHTYEVLLNEKSNLRSLILSKCKLDDDDCKMIASKLGHGAPAEHLQILNLSSNHITDLGAKYISDALRTNRRLRYLSLADNWLHDEGAGYLFGVLMEFPLTCDEIMNMRVRYMKYLKCKQGLYARYLNECNKSFDELSQISRKLVKKRKPTRKDNSVRKYSDNDLKARAEMLANEILGPFIDPFDSKSINRRDNHYYSVGNMVLSYLNLAYNNLSFLSIKKLLNLVMYQNVVKKVNQSGLVKVVVDGNNLPMCKEMVLLNELFGRNIKDLTGKTDVKRRRSRVEPQMKNSYL